jgi:hypothetical protein
MTPPERSLAAPTTTRPTFVYDDRPAVNIPALERIVARLLDGIPTSALAEDLHDYGVRAPVEPDAIQALAIASLDAESPLVRLFDRADL